LKDPVLYSDGRSIDSREVQLERKGNRGSMVKLSLGVRGKEIKRASTTGKTLVSKGPE